MTLFKQNFVCFIILQIFAFVRSDEYRVEITSDGPIVTGATIHFNGTLYYGDNLASGEYEYSWFDNAIPPHSAKITSNNPIVGWDIHFDQRYPPGKYNVEVDVMKNLWHVIPYSVTSNRIFFKLSDTLNGNLKLTQGNVTRKTQFISTAEPIIHSVQLTKPDSVFIENATSVMSYWFIDCVYQGPTNNGQFNHTFSTSGEDHTIDVLMIADFNPPPPPPTTTTTTTTPKPTTTLTTIKPTTSITTLKPNTTTIVPVTTSTTSSYSSSVPPSTIQPNQKSTLKSLQKRSASNNEFSEKTQKIMVNLNGSLVPYNGSFPYVCNGTVAIGDNKSYGYFSRKIVTRNPISSVNVTGNNWLQQGEILALNVLCDGSPSLQYCIEFKRGSYNATGNETCPIFISLETCNFLVQRYLSHDSTVLMIIKNDVTKIVKTIAITVYQVKKQAQLSVIVVPVVFSLVAIVLIIFGVAYYIQNRRRFIIEVADFHFGVDYSDMEYKTFRERLQESFMNAFTRAPSPEASEQPNWPPGQSQKYGSMT